MSTDSTTRSALFPQLFSRQTVVAKFDQEHSSSDGAALLLEAIDERIGLSQRRGGGRDGRRLRDAGGRPAPGRGPPRPERSLWSWKESCFDAPSYPPGRVGRSAMTIELNHTIVAARDKEESVRFYERMFGFEYAGPLAQQLLDLVADFPRLTPVAQTCGQPLRTGRAARRRP